MKFHKKYQAGDLLSLQDPNGREVAQAGVLEYCKRDRVHQWHVGGLDPDSGELLPAAIWNRGGVDGTFGSHITSEHAEDELWGEKTFYSVSELGDRVDSIADQVAKIVLIDRLPKTQIKLYDRLTKNRLLLLGLGAVGIGLGLSALPPSEVPYPTIVNAVSFVGIYGGFIMAGSGLVRNTAQ